MIEKITDQNLERYDSRLKEWCDRKFFEKGNYGKYETTEEASAVVFYPAPDTPLEGKVKFSFKETPPASGDKGLSNPSTIEGVSSVTVTRCGKNLCPGTYIYSPSGRGVSATYDPTDGGWTLSGTASATLTPFFYFFTNSSPLNYPTSALYRGLFYTFSFVCSDSNVNLTIIDSNTDDFTDGVVYNIANNSSQTIQISSSCKSFICRLAVARGATVNTKAYIQVELGSTATTFEPYDGTDYTISLSGTYYGGEIDLASGLMTVTWWGHVFDGTETPVTFTTLINNGRCVFFQPELRAKNAENQSCTHLPFLGNFTDDSAHFYVNWGGSNTGVVLFAPYLTQSSFMSWLADEYAAGTPVTVACELKTPATVHITPQQILSLSQTDKYTPRLNTVYTDADSIQISYLKSPIRDEYEKTQAILSLGGNS